MRLIIFFALVLSSHSLQANSRERLAEAAFTAYAQQADNTLERKNQAVLNYLWVDVYAAALYTEPGISPRQAVGNSHRQRLELYYFRAIDREDVIKAAWVTLERQQSAAQLQRLRPELDALHATFADIQPGDRYALDYSVTAGLHLERNGRRVFSSRNAELAHAYLGIWLADNGLSASLREQLLGAAPPQAARVLSQ
ncbi:MAG: chalcone isomerase family protein [Pseudomonas sp.]|nr:chalcone isomerase family protein [Pseudomonas sp.]